MATFLRSLIETKKAAPENAVARAVSGARGGLFGGAVANMSTWDLEQALRQAYERVIWVYRCVDAIASNSSGVPIVIREYNDTTGKIVQDDDLDKLFNRRPNIYETAQQFRYRVASQALLSRRGVFIEVVRNRMGRPVELHVLPNGVTTPIPDATKYVSGYEVITQTQGVVTLRPDQVIWMRVKPHPTDVYAQMTPLVAAGLAADTDFLARLYNRNFLANDGRPSTLIGVSGGLNNEDAEELKRRFSGGPVNAGSTSVIEADHISVSDLSTSPRDAQWMDAVRGSKEDILLAFGVPESVLGNASGRTFDNADAEFEVFWEVTMQPFMDAMASAYDILTVGGMDDNLLVAHNYMEVDVLQRKARRDRIAAMDEVKSGLLTIDEFFQKTNQKTWDVPGTKVLWVPPGAVPVGKDDETTEAAQKLAPVGMPQTDPEASARAGATEGSMIGATAAMNIQAARAWRLAGRKSVPLGLSKAVRLPEAKHLPGLHDQDSHGRIKWRRVQGGLLSGDYFLESATRGGNLYSRATEDDYNAGTADILRATPWGDPSYGFYLESGPVADLRYSVEQATKKSVKSVRIQREIEFKVDRHPYEWARTRVESEIGGLLSAWSRRQELTIIERISGVKARKNTRHWEGEPGTKALDAVYVVDPERWAEDLVESMSDLFMAIAEKEALKAARQMDRAGIVQKLIDEGRGYPGGKTPLDRIVGGGGLARRAVLGHPVTVVEDMIRKSALRQSQKVADTITRMDGEGASITDIKREVRKMIGSRSSWKRGLSVAAATAVMEGARNSVFAQGGNHVTRVWKTVHDEKVRPTHKRAYNQQRTAGNPFLVGGHHLRYPGDPMGPVEETANCRCWVELRPNL